MNLEGDMGVIEALKEKKRLMEENQPHDHISILLIIDGGFMKGVYGVGAGLVFAELDYMKVFTNCVGISSGAATLAYTMSGQAEVGSTVISEECTTKEFLSMWRWSNPQDSKYLQGVFEGSTGKRLHPENLLNSNFYIGLSVFETAKPYLLRPQTSEELYVGLRASLSMPGVVNDPIKINTIRYIDGASTEPHILEKTCKSFTSTHTLIITNQDKGTGDILWWDRWLTKTLFRYRLPEKLRQVVLRRRKIRHEWVARRLDQKNTNTLFVWGDGSVGSFERNQEKILSAVERSRVWWNEILKD